MLPFQHAAEKLRTSTATNGRSTENECASDCALASGTDVVIAADTNDETSEETMQVTEERCCGCSLLHHLESG
eukprot:754516-Hanusia_phi.AAC.5